MWRLGRKHSLGHIHGHIHIRPGWSACQALDSWLLAASVILQCWLCAYSKIKINKKSHWSNHYRKIPTLIGLQPAVPALVVFFFLLTEEPLRDLVIHSQMCFTPSSFFSGLQRHTKLTFTLYGTFRSASYFPVFSLFTDRNGFATFGGLHFFNRLLLNCSESRGVQCWPLPLFWSHTYTPLCYISALRFEACIPTPGARAEYKPHDLYQPLFYIFCT